MVLWASRLGYCSGSERGQLASSLVMSVISPLELKKGSRSYAEPTMIRAFTNRLKSVGVPIEDYKVSWPDVSTLTDKERVRCCG